MVDTEAIFRYRALDPEKLIRYGFEPSGDHYKKRFSIMRKQFYVTVTVSKNGKVQYQVYDTDTDEEYVLVHVENATGGFVGEIRSACEKVLLDISNKCFHTEVFKGEQTKRMLSYIKSRYDVDPEFLWERDPSSAAFRRKENEKWFAIIMTVDKSKIGLPGHGNIEIIDLKDRPEKVTSRLEEKYVYKAYHMNKKHWYTICLDGGIKDEVLMQFIEASYQCVK